MIEGNSEKRNAAQLLHGAFIRKIILLGASVASGFGLALDLA